MSNMPNAKQLTELQNKFLIDLISYYNNKSQRRERTELSKEVTLKKAFDSILNNEYFKSTLEWFVIWGKKHDEPTDLSFLVGGTGRSRRIIGLYTHKDYSKHFFKFVTTFSVFCSKYKQPDTSFIISTTPYRSDIGKRFYRHFVLLNFEDIAKMWIDEIHDETKIEPSNAIEVLKKQYDILKNKIEQDNNFKQRVEANIVNPISRAFDTTILDEDEIVKFINSFCWLKLAHPENWKMMIYFPGIISKEFEGVPLGVNIGLKEVVPDNIVFFLNMVTLLFCTRESVDFFEEWAKREEKKRTRDVHYLNKLLGDFQHTILQSIIDSIRYFMKGSASEHSRIAKLLTYISQRGTYLDQLSDFIATSPKNNAVRSVTFNRSALENEFIDSGIFIRKISPVSTISDGINEWRNLFKPKIDLEPDSNINIEGVCWGPIQTIIENLIANSLNYAFDSEKKTKIYIRFCKPNNNQNGETYPAIIYWDDGKGFEKETCNNIPRWYGSGPTLSEGRKGYAYWLIGKIMDHIGGELKLLIYANNNSLIQLDNDNLDAPNYIIPICEEYFKKKLFNNEILRSGNRRIIHILVFKNRYWQELPV